MKVIKMRKISIIFIFLFINICCFGQENNRIRFYKEMPHYSKRGVVWQIDTISYYKMDFGVELYKSSNIEYPYLYKYEDIKKEVHYFFIRKKDIKVNKEKIEIIMYDESNLKLSIKKYLKNLEFLFKLNS